MSDKLIIKVSGEERELFMSFALLTELTEIVISPENIGQIHLDNHTRETVLLSILSERNKGGRVTEPLEHLGDLEISVADHEAILDWAAQHVLDFFIRSIQRGAKITSDNREKMELLASSLDGLKDSASKSQSSGASA